MVYLPAIVPVGLGGSLSVVFCGSLALGCANAKGRQMAPNAKQYLIWVDVIIVLSLFKAWLPVNECGTREH